MNLGHTFLLLALLFGVAVGASSCAKDDASSEASDTLTIIGAGS